MGENSAQSSGQRSIVGWQASLWEPEVECQQVALQQTRDPALSPRLCGVDEVGMGCLAGPVVAAAVILDPKDVPKGITDSKLLTAKKREGLAKEIKDRAVAWGIGWAEVDEIDRINIFHAGKRAMERAVSSLKLVPEVLLVDGKFPIQSPIPQRCYIKGDQKSVSIGAASILAKVYRDSLMLELDSKYPGYGFAKHKGYGSKLHRMQIQTLGPTPLHRKSFSWTPV